MDRQDLRAFDRNEIIGGYCVRYNPAVVEWEKANKRASVDPERQDGRAEYPRESDDRSNGSDESGRSEFR